MNNKLVVGILLSISVILRLINLNQSLWLDEAINVLNASTLPIKALVFNYSLGDFHPPLYHILLRSWTWVLPPTEIFARLPSVILGAFTVLVTYLIAKKLFDNKTALAASTLLATSPLHIYYSQEARMYALAAALVALSVYFFISILEKASLFNWLGFISSTILMLYSDYLPYTMMPVYIFFLILNKKIIKKHTLQTFLPALILIIIFLTPWWLLIFPKQFATGLSAATASPAWAQVVGSPDPRALLITFVKFTIGRISINSDLVYALAFAPIGLYISFLLFFSLFRLSSKRSLIWIWLIFPPIIAYLISYQIPVYAYFRFIFVLPAFYIILASAINIINWPSLNRTLLAIALSINLISAITYFSNPAFQRENWRQATNFVKENATDKTVALFESNYTVAPFDYYNEGEIEAWGALNDFNPDKQKVKERIVEKTKGKNRAFLFQYLSGITDPDGLAFKELSDLGFINTKIKDFNGVGFVYEFTK